MNVAHLSTVVRDLAANGRQYTLSGTRKLIGIGFAETLVAEHQAHARSAHVDRHLLSVDETVFFETVFRS